MQRILLSLLFAGIVFIVINGQPARDTLAWNAGLPADIKDSLAVYQKNDDLVNWLYSAASYAESDPVNGVRFLEKARSKTWRPLRDEKEKTEWFYFLCAEGYCYRVTGNILRSIDAYEEAYRYFSRQPLPGMDVLEYVMKPLGNNYTRLGDYDRALFIQEKGLNEALAAKNNEQAASFYSNLAITATGKGDLAKARTYSEAGLQVLRKDTALYGLLLSELADVLFRTGQMEEAKSTMQEAISVLQRYIHQKANTRYWLYSAFLTQGELLREKGELSASLQSFAEGKKIIDSYGEEQFRRERGKLLVGTGSVLLKLNQPASALRSFNDALEVLLPQDSLHADTLLPDAGGLYGENTILDALHGKADCLLALDRKEEALQHYLLLFVVERKLRHEFFSAAAKQQQQKENRKWVEKAMETAFQLWQTGHEERFAQKMLLIAEMSKSQLLLDEMMQNLQSNQLRKNDSLLSQQLQAMQAIAFYERESILNPEKAGETEKLKKQLQYDLSLIDKRVREKYPQLKGYMINDSIELNESELIKQIPEGVGVVEFFEGEESIYIIYAATGIVNEVIKLNDAPKLKQDIRSFVDNYFQQGPEKMMNEPGNYYRTANHIYRQVWPIQQRNDHYMIIPDGMIGYLPFDALITDSAYHSNIDQWPFLARKNNMFFSYSLQTWQQQQKAERPHRSSAGFFVSFDSSKNASIPAVKQEMAAMKKEVRGKYFQEKEASFSSFQAQLNKVNLLHISTHAFLQGEQQVPVLQLSDSKFFLFELFGQAFQPQLVVLSACRTGHGMLAEGEGIISLARGFTATGAGGIVAGLWNMNDEAIAELMGRFYHQLSKEKRSPSSSLYLAKKEWLNETHDQAFKKLPYFWAGVIYVGDDQPVTVRSNDSMLPWLSLAAIAFVLIATIYFVWRIRRM